MFEKSKKYYLNAMMLILILGIVHKVIAVETGPGSGAELYQDFCSVCHGDKGDGNSRARGGLATKPRDFTTPGLGKYLSREQMIYVVLNGKPGTAMMGWKTRLNQQQAESIVDFIRNTFMSDETVSTTNKLPNTTMQQYHSSLMEQPIMEQPMPENLTGNYEDGEKFYQNNCSTCHGVEGDGNGPRAFFIFPKPRNFLTQDSRHRLNRPVLFYAIKNGIRGKEMPAWGKVLSDQQIADIAEYVFTRMIIQPDEE